MDVAPRADPRVIGDYRDGAVMGVIAEHLYMRSLPCPEVRHFVFAVRMAHDGGCPDGAGQSAANPLDHCVVLALRECIGSL